MSNLSLCLLPCFRSFKYVILCTASHIADPATSYAAPLYPKDASKERFLRPVLVEFALLRVYPTKK